MGGAVLLESWRPYVWVFLLATLVYAPTAWFDFSPLDDSWLVVNRSDVLADPSHLPLLFTQPLFEDSYYRPILALSFALDFLVGGGSPLPFHLTNILLHGLVSAVLFRFLTMLGSTRTAAFALAAVFTVHPVHVHAVAWIPGRNDLILALLALLTAMTFLNYLRSQRAGWLILHLILLFLALTTKENAIVLPV